MSSRLATVRHRYRRWLNVEQRRGVRVLAWVSVVCLVGVSVTGIWQFFAHEPDPAWFLYRPGFQPPSAPSTGMAELHSMFAMATASVALLGGGWLVYKVLYAVPWPVMAALGSAVFGLISGSVIRYNAVKLTGRDLAEAERGYTQIFGGDLEYVVTSRFELGAAAIRVWTVAHLLTVPVLLAVIWFGLPRRDDPTAE